jgi:mono/diheme cytochrome c family protein
MVMYPRRRGDTLSIGTRTRFPPHPFLLAVLLATEVIAQGPPATDGGISAFSARKAETLLRSSLSCLGCHTLNGEGGRIGPDLTTVRERRSAEYITAMLVDPERTVPGAAMPRPLLSPATRALVTRYLASRPGNATSGASPDTARPSRPPQSPDGPALYRKWCSACHGASGAGDGPNAAHLPLPPKPHVNASILGERSDDVLYDMIAGGGGIMNRSPRMPAFGGSLSPAEIRALIAHLRSLCKCLGPRWSRED